MLLATTLVLAMPLAIADETNPDCEDGQMWIGYTSTTAVRGAYEDLGSPGSINPCEGEHWDGQDTVAPGQPGNCAGTVNPNPSAAFVGLCMGSDPNTMPNDDPLTPLGLRVASAGGATYAGANIALVGYAVIYQDGDTVAVYLRDNTPGEVLATVVSAAGITKGTPGDADCDQATYNQGAQTGDRTLCHRDNTAITIEHGLA